MDAMKKDADPQETCEWIEALDGVIAQEGPDRAHFLIERVIGQAREAGINLPYSANTEYINTIPVDKQVQLPGDFAIEQRIRHYVRWNAMAMVVRANKDTNVGGHIASFASAAALYDVGFSHFWHAPTAEHGGDLIFFQGHSVPGVYSRAFMLGRLTEEQLDNFRQETDGKGISSYPHPWLMPDFWQFPTVSMGLGPIQAIYQARFMKYLASRGLIDAAKAEKRKVWAFLGDGETDEVESLGAISMAGREKLDNLIFVINCNLQRLDGPVLGNGKIVQELEGEFRGSGWNVIKLLWGNGWDQLLARDKTGKLKQLMMETLDGDYQAMKANDGAFVRKNFFGKYPETLQLVEHMTDEEVFELRRGGHEPTKVYATFHAANEHKGQPTVLLIKTVKGYGLGSSFAGRNATHQSTTDPESVLYREAKGQAAKLCFGGHLLMENRNGLCADFTIHDPIAEPAPVVARQQIQAHQALHAGVRVKTVGADKGDHQKRFVAACRDQHIAPHVACKDGVKVAGLDGRTTAKESYRISQRLRKRVEEILGWVKTVGGLRRSRRTESVPKGLPRSDVRSVSNCRPSVASCRIPWSLEIRDSSRWAAVKVAGILRMPSARAAGYTPYAVRRTFLRFRGRHAERASCFSPQPLRMPFAEAGTGTCGRHTERL